MGCCRRCDPRLVCHPPLRPDLGRFGVSFLSPQGDVSSLLVATAAHSVLLGLGSLLSQAIAPRLRKLRFSERLGLRLGLRLRGHTHTHTHSEPEAKAEAKAEAD